MLQNFVSLLKRVIAILLISKANLNVNFKYVCITLHSLVMSPFSHDLMKMLVKVFTVTYVRTVFTQRLVFRW